MSITWLEKDELILTILKKIDDADVVLDIGCGIRPQDYILPKVHIYCDPCKQYIEHLRDKVKDRQSGGHFLQPYGLLTEDRENVFIHADWAKVIDKLPPKSVDTVFLLDVIEHLEKDNAQSLLKATEDIARHQIVVFTPLGFVAQSHPDGKDNWGLDGGKWQEHKSGFLPEDFDDTWDIYAARIFHTHDHTEAKYAKPFGAFWAIKNLRDSQKTSVYDNSITLTPRPKEFILKETAYKKAPRAELFCRQFLLI